METVTGNIAKLLVVGIGGGGGNAVNAMVENGISDVDFLAMNTDKQALSTMATGVKRFVLGEELTKGLGAGANPEIGRQAAEESRETIKQILDGTDLLFIAAGMGGGTGTGAAPIVAQVARELGILTIAVVTKPFNFEGARRMRYAEEG
ncbi:MAG: cell division protein FtsZ, partial [Candidatus Fimimonas sp.]